MIDSNQLRLWAQELGFAETGFCSVEGFEKERALIETQQKLAERRQLRFFPEEDEPQGKSLAVLLWPYQPALKETDEALFVDGYYFASNAAYQAARKLEDRIIKAGCFAKANVPYPAKAAAIRAGLGWIGKNSLLHTKQFGTRAVIILMLTDIEAVEEEARQEGCKESCLGCNLCIKACPSGALDENGMSHPERCMRNFMMEGIVAPEHIREKMGMKLFGCDLCQRACPMQPEITETNHSQYKLKDFVTDDSQAFSQAADRFAREIGRNVARPQRIRAQAAILAGNSKNAEYLPVLRQWAQLPFEAVSEHAKWAIQRIEMESGGT